MRTFAGSQAALPGSAATKSAFWDDEDREREPLLREILESPIVRAVAYPTIGHRDVLQVYLRGTDDLTFACVLVSGERLRAMVEQSTWVAEGFALQVASGERLTIDGVRAAVQTWIERVFPGMTLPQVALEQWTGPQGIAEDVLAMLLSGPSRTMSEAAPTELAPDPTLADPPYLEAA